MKKSITLLAGLAAAAISTQASAADLVVRFTGSSAFRGLVDTKLTAASPAGLGYTRQAGASGSTYQVYTKVTNTPNTGDKTIITTSWTGSVAGIKTVASGDGTVNFLPTDSTVAAPVLTPVANFTPVQAVPDIAFSDVFQSSTLYTTPTLTKTRVGIVQFRALTNFGKGGVFTTAAASTSGATTITVADATGVEVGMTVTSATAGFASGTKVTAISGADLTLSVATTADIASGVSVSIGSNPITKVNYQQLRALFSTSTGLPLSVFTGNSADTAKVYGIGRDPDSGTRITLLAESGIGANSTVTHWQPHVSTTNTNAIDTMIPWPISSAFGVTFDEGNGGYASGGDLAKIMRYSTSSVAVSGGTAAPCYFISFAGTGDASTVIAASGVGAGPGKILTIENADADGASLATLASDIAQGKNPMWSYEWCYHNGLTGDKAQLYTDLTTLMAGSQNGLLGLADMKVQRLIDGGTILPK